VANPVTIGVIGDFNAENPTHLKTNSALSDAGRLLDGDIKIEWLPTPDLVSTSAEQLLRRCDGLWCSPGSPYQSMEGALTGIKFAREQGVPFIGTCGGFQHAVIEFARNVLGYPDAETEESNASASSLFITRLACSVFDKTLTVRIKPGSRARQYIGSDEIAEYYYCNFGLNPEVRDAIDAGGLKVTGEDPDGEARIVELPEHPFFIGTLFLPQQSSTSAAPHPLILAFLEAAAAFRSVVGDRWSVAGG
jgi:CTP synthase (UTP-ammonia lyase)